jgi:hypothetical protein
MALACAGLILAGCAAPRPSSPPRQEIAIVAGIPSPAKYTVIGHVRGFDFSDLEDQARAQGGDAITAPMSVSLMGLLESDVLKKR